MNKITSHEWYERFKNGNFHVEDPHSGGRRKVFENAKFKVLLKLKGSWQNRCECQQVKRKHLKKLEIIPKQGYSVP